MKAQTIQIDSTFTDDGEIFPFGTIQSLTELLAGGEVSLSSDTSLVRIILVGDDDIHYLVFEAYPLICDSLDFSFAAYCDETCSLDDVEPYSLIVKIIHADLYLKDLVYSSTPKSNPETLRYEAKRDKDFEKIDALNKNIPDYGMSWIAGDNSVVEKYYNQKRFIYSDGFNLLGYDYYYDGVFEFLGHRNYPKVDPDIVWEFDWRNRHGIDDPASEYWDGNEEIAGWLTGAKKQGDCGSCWAFSSVGTAEAIVNLFTARTYDYDLSEQDLLCNDDLANGCDGSPDPYSGLLYIKNEGIVTDVCLPYDTIDYDDSCFYLQPCSGPDTLIQIFDTLYLNTAEEIAFDNIRDVLINKGPLKMKFPRPTDYHSVVLSGYRFNIEDSTLTFLVKDSQGMEGPNKGFKELKLESIRNAVAVVPPIYRNDTALVVECHDYDNDGYCFWGIGEKPENCECQSNIEDCDDNDSLVGGYDENYNCRCIFELDTFSHHIVCDTNWADSIFVNYNTIIDSGFCLTISSYAAFAPGARIIVKPGARLLIDGGYLTRACNELWEGIEVWGSDTAQFFAGYFGKLMVKNNAVIEFAEISIANYCKRCMSLLNYSGGIIEAENTTFRNNEIDVKFAKFKNLLLGNELPYLGIFDKCLFLTTVEIYPISDPVTHIDLEDVYGVKFDGCTFKNDLGLSAIPNSNRGRGISSIDANFMLREYCNTPNTIPCYDLTPCEFIGLEYGIKALNSYSLRTLDIRHVNFEDNLVGISLSGIDYVSILENSFKCPINIIGVSNDRFKGGLFLENCTGYHVEGNDFGSSDDMEGKITPAYGIGIKNSGPENNEIYNNDFKRLSVGIIAIGENRGERDTSGLCLKCNEMSQNTNDFVVVEDDGPLTGIQGIRLYQGNPDDTISATAPAGNTFTFHDSTEVADYNDLEYFNYFNNAEILYYLHHQKRLNPVTYPLDSNYTSETIERIERDVEYDKSLACPSGIDSGYLKSYTSPRENILEADNHISSLKNQLNALIDGGNTEWLNIEVLTSLPDEGLELSQELLGDSPYLSDTVIKQAIYREDVLPNAMIRDIMAANPQSAKKNDLLEALDGRYDPMPDYMMAQIMEGREYFGAKEMLEAEIQSWQQLRSKAKNELMRQFLLDTTIVHPMDSVIAFLETENDLSSKYGLAFAYWNKEDSINAWQSFNNIPIQFTLSDNQTYDHQQYGEYFDILQQLADSNWRACDLDSTSVESLFNLMEDGNADISANARGLLVKGGFMDYVETVIIPSYSKSGPIVFNSKEEVPEQPKSENLKLFPNPSGDYVIAYYDVNSDYLSASIIIYYVKGNMLRKYLLKAEENQVVLNLSDLPNGIYLIALHANGQILDVKKLSKGRY